MNNLVRKIVKSIMPKDGILYTPEYHTDWEPVAVANESGEVYKTEAAYAVIQMDDGNTFYVPFIAPGFFAVPPEEVKEFTVHPISEELLNQFSAKETKKKNTIAFGLVSLLIVGLIAPSIIKSHREKEYNQAINIATNALIEEKNQEIRKDYQREQDRAALEDRIAEVTAATGDVYVLTNAPAPIQASLGPNHIGLGIGITSIAAAAIYDNNPARDFLDNEDKYGFTLMLALPEDEIRFPQSRIAFTKAESQEIDPETPVLTVTVSTKYSDTEIDAMIANNPNLGSRQELEKFEPALIDGYIRQQYWVTPKELETGTLTFSNIHLQNRSFDMENTRYFVSATNGRLPLEEQKALIDQLRGKFGIPTEALSRCCSWQQVTFQ
ncbi:hypothetical protein LRP50_12310 [Enterovibrio sp. ZSDZ42]|uniref:Uncharacterized protein n=1 Tax=Enterovibrio gelatinilyticus TaxID=2899819 RepID=A0ABT5R0X6_9GAMM|nr:hypothetical protein [Enterovibrio sp. ZSDZ42]MDD1793918.1 hypothetical protein [Enterovibrio sp. ZSDZ42]